jgi:hypothetical protein
MPVTSKANRLSSQRTSTPEPVVAKAKFTRAPAAAKGAAMLEKAVREFGLASSVMVVPANAKTSVVDLIDDKDMPFFKQPTHLKVTEKPAPAKLQATVLICVSGHTDEEDKFARSNTYSVRVTLPDGRSDTLRRIPRSKSVEYVTAIDLSIPLSKGTTTIEAWPDGTSVGGYSEGRTIKVEL